MRRGDKGKSGNIACAGIHLKTKEEQDDYATEQQTCFEELGDLARSGYKEPATGKGGAD